MGLLFRALCLMGVMCCFVVVILFERLCFARDFWLIRHGFFYSGALAEIAWCVCF